MDRSLCMPVAMVWHEEYICLPRYSLHTPLVVAWIPIQHLETRITKEVLCKIGRCAKDDAILLMGDLNAVSGSKPYQRLRAMGLTDVRSKRIWGYMAKEGPIFLSRISIGPCHDW